MVNVLSKKTKKPCLETQADVQETGVWQESRAETDFEKSCMPTGSNVAEIKISLLSVHWIYCHRNHRWTTWKNGEDKKQTAVSQEIKTKSQSLFEYLELPVLQYCLTVKWTTWEITSFL